jgi:hypothetical protein
MTTCRLPSNRALFHHFSWTAIVAALASAIALPHCIGCKPRSQVQAVQAPKIYQSVGSFEIDPIVKSPDDADRGMSQWKEYITTVVGNLHSDGVMLAAMNDPQWKAHRPQPADAYLPVFSKNLSVRLVPNTFIVNVAYTDDAADARVVAPIAVASIIHAYENGVRKEELKDVDERISALKTGESARLQKIADGKSAVDKVLGEIGADPQVLLQQKYESHFRLQKQMNDLAEQIKNEAAGTPDIAEKQKQLKALQDRYNDEKQPLDDLGHQAHRIRVIRAEQHRLEEEQTRLQPRLDELQNKKAMIEGFKVIDYGTTTTSPAAPSNP